MIYFTSDTHFSHKNVIDFCNRPFSDVEEMNKSMIEVWNKYITDRDTIYHLGDFHFGKNEEAFDILSQLKGKIILIKGNHDPSQRYRKAKELGLLHDFFVATYMKHNKKKLWLSHIPMEIEESRTSMWNISGHIHDNPSSSLKQINVGVDSPLKKYHNSRDFGHPYSIEDVHEIISDRQLQINMKYGKM